MTFIHRVTACILVSTCLSGCVRTYSSHLPTGQAAYAVLDSSSKDAFSTEYTLQPGDKIRVEVFQEADLTAEQILVDPSGSVSLPLLGSLHAGGLTPAKLEQQVQAALAARYLRNPKVSVSLIDTAVRTVSVEGEVKQPGTYPINRQTTLLSALSLARSPTVTAKLNEVLVFRMVNGQRVGGRFDVALIRAGRANDPQILPDDVIVVGYSRVLGAYRDFLQAAPLINTFSRY